MHELLSRMGFALVVLSLLVLSPRPLYAQDSATTATLIGSVHDTRGAIISGSSITLRNLTTNQRRTLASDADGSYRIAALPVGDYEVRVEATGFAPYLNPKVTLALGRSAALDISLPPGEVNAQVTVTDSPPALDATQTAVTTSIDPERIEELPVNSRNYLEFTLLAPGVAPSNQQNGGGSSATSGSPLADSGFTFGGLRPRSNINFLLASGFAPRLSVRSLTPGRFRIGTDETEMAAKLTYVASQRHTLNFRFALTNLRERSDAFNTDVLSDRSARGSAYIKDYQSTASAISVLSPKLINDVRFQASTRRAVTRAGDEVSPEVQIIGLARFGRPFDADSARRETHEQVVDNISLSRSRSEWKGGVTINHVSLNNEARDVFGGLYIFRTLDDFGAGRPAIWRQAFGAPRTQFGVTSFGGFLQNQWRVTPQLTLNLGGRYDMERLPLSFRTDANNFSPRLGLAWSPSKEWVVRAGFGLFYDRLPLAFLNRAIQKNGVQAFEQVATDADAAGVFAVTGGGRALATVAGIAPSIFHADPRFVTPYSAQANVGVERLLSEDITVRVDYLFTRGIHLPRTRNISLLPPVVLTSANAAALGFSSPTQQQLGRPVFGPGRVDPRFDAIYQFEDSASSTYHGLTLALNKRLSNEFELLASYTLSKTRDGASDFDEQPQNPFDLRSDRALSRQDVRHRFVLSSLFDLPFGEEEERKGGNKGGNDLLGTVLGHIEIAPIVTLSSGRPVNPLTGADEEHSRAFPLASRPRSWTQRFSHTAIH